MDEEGFEPSTSAMPTLRSFQTDLLALFLFIHKTVLITFLRVLLIFHVDIDDKNLKNMFGVHGCGG